MDYIGLMYTSFLSSPPHLHSFSLFRLSKWQFMKNTKAQATPCILIMTYSFVCSFKSGSLYLIFQHQEPLLHLKYIMCVCVQCQCWYIHNKIYIAIYFHILITRVILVEKNGLCSWNITCSMKKNILQPINLGNSDNLAYA